MSISSSLSFVTEHTPAWVGQLDELTSKISSCKIELSELSSELATYRLRAKNGSTESLRPGMANEVEHPVDNGPFEMDSTLMLANAAKQQHAQMLRRKRKTTSLSSDAEPQKYRTRSMIIIRYDSQVQDGFVDIVKNVSTARNNLRKARMQETMAERMRQTEARGAAVLPPGGEALASRLAFSRTARSRGGGAGGAAGEDQKAYDIIDKNLESAMSMCEHAAHQSLRDGDCAIEIQTIKERLQEAVQMAEREMVKAKAKEATAMAKDKEEAQRQEAENDGDDESDAKGKGKATHEPLEASSLGDGQIEAASDDG